MLSLTASAWRGSLCTMNRGRFITLEGGEGAGKTTQRAALASALRQAGLKVVETREPGGSPGAEEIRELLVQGEAGRWDAQAEALLVCAARRDHVQRLISPALQRGEWVLCDRFIDSTYAYQGYGHGLDLEQLRSLNRFAIGDLKPDLTLLFDLPVEAGLARAAERGKAQRFETLELEFHQRVRRGFMLMAAQEPKRFAMLDASQRPDEVTAAMLKVLGERLGIRV